MGDVGDVVEEPEMEVDAIPGVAEVEEPTGGRNMGEVDDDKATPSL